MKRRRELMSSKLIDSPWKMKMVKEIMKILPKFSTENLVKMATLAEKITTDEDLKGKARGMREFFATGYPSILLAEEKY
jgi:hypothetical protein